MRIGVVLDARALDRRLNVAHLVRDLTDGDTVAWSCDGIETEALRALVQAHGLEGLVVGAGDDESVHSGAMRALLEARADRFAFRVIDLDDLCGRVHSCDEATRKARLLLSAAVAMVRQYRGCRQANIRTGIGQRQGRLSRRTLLTLPMLRYEVVPAVDESRCFASRGCRLCLTACPAEAVAVQAGAASIQKESCLDCGLCLAACPAKAIEHPLYRREILDAGLIALLADASDRQGAAVVVLACPGGMQRLRDVGHRGLTYPPDVLPLEVPSAGIADWYLVLRAFDLGAAGVALVTCGGEKRCACSSREIESSLAAMGQFLESGSLGKARLLLVAEESPHQLASKLNAFAESLSLRPRPALAPTPPVPADIHRHEVSRLIAALWTRLGLSDDFSVAGSGLPIGHATLDESLCSLCGLCAESCPAGALLYEEDESARLLLTPGRCTACGICADLCPEAALSIEAKLAMTSLRGRPQTLKTTPMTRCQHCGTPFAPEAMFGRVISRLQQSPSAVLNCCPDCRIVAAAARTPATAE